MMELGDLKEINIRDIWKHELEFSQWLADEENINKLGKALDITLEDVITMTEVSTGEFKSDIVCKDPDTKTNIVIENQLEPTNHDHLGKIITYASGLDASIVIWIVSKAREEHKAAVEWLNEHTDEKLSFFLVEIHAYVIGNSKKAPKFEVIIKPNSFLRSTEKSNSPRKMHILNFWTKFNDLLDQKKTQTGHLPFNKRKATTHHVYEISMGSSSYKMHIDLVNQKNKVRVGLQFTKDETDDNSQQELYNKFCKNKNDINLFVNKELQKKLNWDDDGMRVDLDIPNLNFDQQNNYPELMDEIINTVVVLKKEFSKYLKN